MNTTHAALALAVASLGVSVYLVTQRAGDDAGGSAVATAGEPRGASRGDEDPGVLRLRRSVEELSQQLHELRATLGNTQPTGPGAGGLEDTSAPVVTVGERLDSLQTSLASLQSAFDGVSLEKASAERDALFRGEDGHLKADEYAAAGKHAIAAEGYLKFLEAYPEHPDAYDILRRARNAFRRAGYMDKAIWAQKQLIENSPERTARDLGDLAVLEKQAGQYEGAIEHVAEAADLLEGSERLWRRLYWAWYNQLGRGNQAGLQAYREVEQEIVSQGFSDHKLGERVREKIAEIERMQAAAGPSL